MENAAETQLVEGRKHAPCHLGDVLLLGLGVTGNSVLAYCGPLLGGRLRTLSVLTGSSSEGFLLAVSDSEGTAEQRFDSLEQLSGSYDLCIASPGISQFGELYQAAASRCSETISEVEFAWRESAAQSRWVAVTGTNGKTTTTALCAHLLSASGFRAAAVGNIGDTCLDAVAKGDVDVYVAEVSSYQLASTSRFAPDCAVMLNITPDHLAWHKSMDAYVQAKGKLLANLDAGSWAVFDAANELSRGYLKKLRAEGVVPTVPVGTSAGIEGDMRLACGSDNAAFSRNGMLVVALEGQEIELVGIDELTIVGPHNAGNALAAASAALAVGASADALRKALKSFQPLPHRMESVGEIGGVACYNDSKATNVDATLVALRSFAGKDPIVLLGGDDKNTPLTELAHEVAASCKCAVCFGDAGPRFFEAMCDAGVQCLQAGKLADALDAALSVAAAGDVVLLSPACASFDEFSNFEQRGEVFKQLVAERAQC